MIVVDTSAMFAIAARENERDSFVGVLDRTDVAQSRNAPLLFKGGNFSQTDIAAAWQP